MVGFELLMLHAGLVAAPAQGARRPGGRHRPGAGHQVFLDFDDTLREMGRSATSACAAAKTMGSAFDGRNAGPMRRRSTPTIRRRSPRRWRATFWRNGRRRRRRELACRLLCRLADAALEIDSATGRFATGRFRFPAGRSRAEAVYDRGRAAHRPCASTLFRPTGESRPSKPAPPSGRRSRRSTSLPAIAVLTATLRSTRPDATALA